MRRLAALLFLIAVAAPTLAAPGVRIKDLTQVEGVRSNSLHGYGLVVGLQGTGDGTQAAFTIQSLANLLRRSGITVPQSSVRVRNVAAVMVTTELPPFSRQGQRLDVQVSSIGDAKSLQGGTLLMTPLAGPDGQTYAVAQGAVSIGGAFLGGGGGNAVQKNHPTAGRIPRGAMVEREIPHAMSQFNDRFRLLLNKPDFATSARIAEALNKTFGETVARAQDPTAVELTAPADFAGNPVSLLARVEAVEIEPDKPARVVINEKTGTVVMGAEVRVSKVALAHGNLTIEVRTDLEASQPAPLGDGDTVILPQRDTFVSEGPNQVLTLEDGISVGDLVEALNVLGVSSRDMIAIFQAMSAAGALHAELVLL